MKKIASESWENRSLRSTNGSMKDFTVLAPTIGDIGTIALELRR
jgi:hypothetical protein